MVLPISYNIRNLIERKTTTLLTALGIALPVAILLVVLALVAGLQEAFQASGSPQHVLVLRKGTNAELNSSVSRQQYQDIKFKRGIAPLKNGEPAASLELVQVVNLPSVDAPDAASLEIIRTCAETIRHAVETVRTLVDEFSVLARFPASRPQPASLNSLVEGALTMFNGRLDGIDVRTELAQDLPPVMADPEAIKRAVANLVDNAAESMQDTLLKEITISTALLASRDAVELIVSDTGHGVSRDVKERLFLPYFSTKQRGTGLGLAIVSRIVEDHRGSIRVEENKPVGSRFVIELPVAVEAMSAPTSA